MLVFDQGKYQGEHQVDDRINEKPADQHHLPDFRLCAIVIHASAN